ncbi:hypothetical protein BVRB_6g131880 [Beta vulgaris subsp. vulgaris]|nr:hypothetical protein BVRB_6g131880 [Beta vulgaris subsp. vulgaris]
MLGGKALGCGGAGQGCGAFNWCCDGLHCSDSLFGGECLWGKQS